MSNPFARTMDWFARQMPTHAQLEKNRYVPKSALRTELWRFTRRSVPRGVALGIIVGIIVPFAQTIFAAILSMPVRANVPLAAAMTFLTNPFTTPILWAFSYKLGKVMLHADPAVQLGPIDSLFSIHDVWGFLHWVSDEGKYLVFGLVVVAVVTGALGYVISSLFWKITIGRRRRRRLKGE